MNSRLENLIEKYLGSYVQEYDSSSLSIGIWQGDIRLKNLVLKSQTFDISENLSFHLVQGIIGEIRIQVPWTQLQSGQVKINIENVHLVFRHDADLYSSLNAHKTKMNNLNQEEIKLFGLQSASTETFSSRLMGSLASSFFQNLLNRFSLTLNNVKVSLLLPLLSNSTSAESKREMCHLRLNIESATIEYFSKPSENEEKLIVSKKIALKGFSVDVNRVVDRMSPNSGTDSPHPNRNKEMFDAKGNALVLSLQHLLSREHQFSDSSILSPVEISVALSILSVPTLHSSVPSLTSDAQHFRIKLEVRTGPIEIWPRLSQLLLLKSATSQFEWECKKAIAKQKCFHLRPLTSPSAKAGNCQSWWKYAFLWELLRLQHWDSPDSLIALFNRTSERHTQRHYKQRYLHLYRKHIESTLRQHAAHSLPSDGIKKSGAWTNLSIDEAKELDFLHRFIDEEKLLLYRAMVHRGLQEIGVTLKSLCDSIQRTPEEPSILSLWGIFGQTQSQKKPSKEKTDDIDAKILTLLDDVKSQIMEERRMVQTLFDCDVTLPGLSVVISEADETEDRMSNMTALLMFSQITISFQQKCSPDYSILSLAIGGIRMYGLHGFELLTCGLVTDLPIRSDSDDQALNLNIEWKVSQAESLSDDVNLVHSALHKTPINHINCSILANRLYLNWNEDAISQLQRGINVHLTELSQCENHVQSKAHIFSEVRMKCAQYSMTNSSNIRGFLQRDSYWSLIFNSKGLVADFPFGDSLDSKRKSSLLITFSSLEAMLGECLGTSEFMNSTAPETVSLDDTLTRSLWPQVNQILRLKYLKLNTSIVESLFFALDGFTIGLRRRDSRGVSTPIEFIKQPWCMKGLYSFSLLPCHKSYPDSQFDLYCSPFAFSIKMKDAIYMIDAIHSSFTTLKKIYFAPSQKRIDPLTSPIPLSESPRIFSLASLCCWRGSVNIDKIQLVLADERESHVAETLKSAMMSYCNHIFDRGGFARVAHTAERLTIQRFVYFGIDLETTQKLLRTLCATAEEIVSHNEDRAKINVMIDKEVNALVQRFELTQYSLPIVALSCYGIHLSDYSFTYDNRRALQIEEILLLDHQCNPICHLFADSQGHYENLSIVSKVKTSSETPQEKKRNHLPKKKPSQRQVTPGETIAKKLESSSLASYCAISLVSTTQDTDFGWGVGGYQVSVLYEQSLTSHLPSKANDVSLQAKNIDILLSSDGIPKIIQTTVPLMVVLYKKFLINFMEADPTLLESPENDHQNSQTLPIKRSFVISFDCAHFVLAMERRYLTELSLTEANLSSRAHHNSNASRTWRLSLDLCEIHDLSPSGSTHPSILTKAPEISSPMIHATFTESEEKSDILLLFQGIRFCILYRYLLEVMIFTTTHFSDPIILELTKLSDSLKGVDILLSEVESLAPSAEDSAVSEEEAESERFHGQRKFHGGFFEYPDYGNEIDNQEPMKQVRGSLNMFGIEKLKLQRTRTVDSIGGNHSPSRSRSMDCISLSEASQKRSSWTVQLKQTTLFFPRNSTTDDLLGVTIRNVNFFQKQRKESWPDPPAEFKLFDQKEVLYFNVFNNQWAKGFVQDPKPDMQRNQTSLDPTKLAKRRVSVETELEMEFYSASEGEGEGDESDLDEFQDAVSEPISRVKPSHSHSQSQSQSQNHSSTAQSQRQFTEEDEPDAPIWRYIFEMEGVDFFSSLAGPYEVHGQPIHSIQMFHRRFQSIQQNKPVYSIISSKRLNSWSKQCWKRISVCSSNILLLVEMTSLTMRVLISETEIPSSINFQLSMSDLYLLMSIYYDNLNEMSDICSTSATAAKGSTATPTATSTPGDSPKHQFAEHPEYGTEEFCEYVHTILSTTDILIVRSDLQLNCSMDNPNNSYFLRTVPNFNYLFDSPLSCCHDLDLLQARGESDYQFATIRLQWLVISCRMNLDVLQVAIGASEGEVLDTRSIHEGANGKQILKFYPRSSSEYSGQRRRIFDHGYANFDFGLKDSPQSIRMRSPGMIPFQITYFSVGYQWSLCNIGSDAPDFDFHNLSLVWLLSDYFSLYFSYPEFGNPSLSPRKTFEQSLFQYFGIDTRVFITRPHLQTFNNPCHPMETLILEAEKGIYYRYVYDSENSVKMELDISDLSLVLMKQYRPPSLSRGIRGVAGSGKQIRTLLEFGSIQFQSHLDAKETTLDYILRIGPEIHEKPLSEETEERQIVPSKSFVDFGKEFLFLPSVSFPPPKCVSPLYIPPRIFPKQSCRIATSYEDILLAIELIKSCIGLTEAQPPQEPTAKPKVQPRSLTNPAIFFLLKVHTLKLIVVDNVLGLHLPLAQIFLSEITATASYNPPSSVSLNKPESTENTVELDMWTTKVFSQRQSFRVPNSSSAPRSLARILSLEDPKPKSKQSPSVSIPTVKALCECLLWGEYFNSMLKCWEPLLDPFVATFLHEQDNQKGVGYVVKFGSPIHLNVSLAMLRALNDALTAVGNAAREETSSSIPATEIKQATISPRELVRGERNRWSLISTIDDIEHVETPPLDLSARVGFSILNLTGYPIRYLQSWEDGHRMTVQYLRDGERGLLNFIASKTIIRDNEVIEESFTSQAQGDSQSPLNRQVGHQVALQVTGFQWLEGVQADSLGVHFEDLEAVVGRMNLPRAFSKSKLIGNSLKLVAEVKPHNGGRLLQLSSVFVVKNSTLHTIHIATSTSPDSSQPFNATPFALDPGETFNVPLGLLLQSVFHSKVNVSTGCPRWLGFLWLVPSNKQIIVDDLGVSGQSIGEVKYTALPIDLMEIVKRTEELWTELSQRDGFDGVLPHDGIFELACDVLNDFEQMARDRKISPLDKVHHLEVPSSRIINFDQLPCFRYNVEVEAVTHSQGNPSESDTLTDNENYYSLFVAKDRNEEILSPPCTYTLAIHPPFIVENLLPMKGTFELVHAKHKTVLWSSDINSGEIKCVHTVPSDEPILLLINLDFCRSSEGVLVTKPVDKVAEVDPSSQSFCGGRVTKTVVQGVKGLMEDDSNSQADMSIILTDSVGQRLRLQVENTVGGGGYRKLIVYCPYWIVNTSQYSLRLRNERSDNLPAGTYNPNRDGIFSAYPTFSGLELGDSIRKKPQRRPKNLTAIPTIEEKVFLGRPGPLHLNRVKEIELDSPLRNLLRDLKFDQVLELASLFNFMESSETNILGTQKVTAQLEDSTWSKAFTLESAGVNQVLSVNHPDLGMLELAFKVSSAPGRWAPYTKIVRFSPRFVIVNKLTRYARVTQINGFFSENIPIDVLPGHLRPFHLPEVFGERQLAVDIEGPWMRSVPFDIDQLGTYALKLRRQNNTGSLYHIVTRGNLQYDVAIPPGEIGIWFETDWNHQQIVVRSIRPNSHAATRTDIQPGDALLAIDNESISQMEFDEVMRILKTKQGNGGCTLTLLTVEEKMRRIRESAITGVGDDLTGLRQVPNPTVRSLKKTDLVLEDHPKEIAIKVEMRAVDSSIFMIISDLDERPEYRVENFSCCHTIHFRQKGVSGSRWATLAPGHSTNYIWDDPLKPHRLLLRVGKNFLCPSPDRINDLSAIYEHSFRSGFNQDMIAFVLFDEIGYKAEIPMNNMESKLLGVVESEGPTKVLCISPHDHVQEDELKYGINFSNEQMMLLSDLQSSLQKLLSELERQLILPGPALQNCLLELFTNCLKEMKDKQDQCLKVLFAQCEDIADIEDRHLLTVKSPIDSILGPVITEPNMIILQVLETAGLKCINGQLSGTNEVYCEVYLRTENHDRRFRQQQETYVNDKMIDPFWLDQVFLFKVPVTPDQPIRGYNVRVRVRSKSVVGFDDFLGEADVQFSSLIDEQEIVGWFSLKPKASSITSSPESVEVSGSVKVRAQWIHSSESLLNYLLNAVDRRRATLSSHLSNQQRILRKKQKIDINFSKSPSKLRLTRRDGQHMNSPEMNRLDKRKPSLALKSVFEDRESNYQGAGFTSYFSYFNYFRRIAHDLPLPKRALTMIRASSVQEENDNFLLRMAEDTRRCYTHVNITSGRLEITAVQALNLPSSDRPVYINFSYGDDRFKTFHAPPTAHPTWLNTDEANDRFDSVPDRSSWSNRNSIRLDSPVRAQLVFENLTYVTEVDTLNIKGTICLSVKQDSFPKNVEICRLELPVFSVLDCVANQAYGQESYDRWFPLRSTAECTPREGDMGTSFYAPTSEKTYSNMFQYHPCIRLIIRWQPAGLIMREKSLFYSRLSLPALTLSMIDSNRAREIMQISISDIEARHSHSEESTDTNVILSWLQVDNQLPESVSPVIVSPTKVLHPQPAFRLHIKKNNILSHDHLESYDYFQIILQELDLRLEQQIVVSVWEFVKSVMNDIKSRKLNEQTDNRREPGSQRISRPSASNIHPQEPEHSPQMNTDSDIDKIYVDHFYIAPIMINISFIMNPQALSSSAVDPFDDKNLRNGSEETALSEHSTLNLFLWQVGEVVLDLTSSITDAPIKLNGMTVDHLFKTWGEVSSTLQDHYLNSALGQLYRIVGSLDLVGNPVGLLSSLGVGVRDFFYEPAYAIITTPTEFKKIGRGVMKGAVSLASNTADGLLGTATNFTRSFGKGVAALTMDEIFLRNRERLNKPPLSTSGYLSRPVKDIANGVFCGVVGVVRVPYHGAKQHGASGLFFGVGKGIAGVAAKPVVGVLDAFTHTGDGIRYLVKSASTKRGIPPKRRRHSNLFGPDGRLMPYSYSAAYGAHFLDVVSWTSSTFPLKFTERESMSEERPPTKSSSRIFESLSGNALSDADNNQRSPIHGRKFTSRNRLMDSIHHLESVIYTSVITRAIGLDQLVVVTTLRVVVGECRQERGGSSGHILWQSRLGHLKKPKLERSGGGTVSLVLNGVNSISRKSQVDHAYTITGEYEILRNLFNCLNTILHNFHLLIPLYNGDDTWEEDENNMIQIGSWQYFRADKSSKRRASHTRFSNVMPLLQDCDWVFGLTSTTGMTKEENLMFADIAAAISSHQEIRKYKQKAEFNSADPPLVQEKKMLLRDSLIEGKDFDALIGSVSNEIDLISSDAWKKETPSPTKVHEKGHLKKLIRKSMALWSPQNPLETNEGHDSTNIKKKLSTDSEGTSRSRTNSMELNRTPIASVDVGSDCFEHMLPSVDEKSDEEKDDDPKIARLVTRGPSAISKLFRSSGDDATILTPGSSSTRKIFQNPKKYSSGYGESDREESRGDSSAPSDEKESYVMHTDMQNGGPHHGYALVPDGMEGDAISALSNGDSIQISEVMDRLGRMEDLLATILQRANKPG